MKSKLTRISELAQTDVGNISDAEQKVIESVSKAQIADLSRTEQIDEESTELAILRPDFLRWLLVNSEVKKFLDPKGIRIRGAIFPGSLDLENISLQHPLHLLGCNIDGRLILEDASLSALVLDGTQVSGVYAPGLKVNAWLFMREGFHSRGDVNLAGASIGQSLVCDGSMFECDSDTAILAERIKVTGSEFMKEPFCAHGVVRFYDAQFGGSLECDGGRFFGKLGVALDMERIKTGGHVNLRDGFFAQGKVNLMDASIGGNLECWGGRFLNRGSVALDAERATVTGSVFLRDVYQNNGFRAIGEVRLLDAKIGGNVECDGARLMNRAGVAFNAERARIGGGIFLRTWFQSYGEILLRGTDIGKDLDCSTGQFTCPEGVAFNGAGMQVKGDFYWLALKEPPAGRVILVSASVTTLEDDPGSWPSHSQLELNGFEYRYIYPNRFKLKQIWHLWTWLNRQTAPNRADWLSLVDPRYFSTQPYEQLSTVYKRLSMEKEAKDVAIARHRALIKYGNLTFLDRFKNRILGLTIDYGYNTAKVIFLFIIPLIILGGLIFQEAYEQDIMAATQSNLGISSPNMIWDDPEYPTFNPWAYSLDVFLPIIDLHQEDYWIPYNRASCTESFPFDWLSINAARCGEWFLFYMWFHIASGWLLSTLAVASVTGLIKRE